MVPILQVVKLSPNATIPTRGSPLSAGLDLSSAVDLVIPPRDKGLVMTDIAIMLPEGMS
jgi:dUTPase